MPVKAIFVGKISGQLSFLVRPTSGSINKYWGLLFFAILLFSGQPAYVVQAATTTADAPCNFIASDETSFNFALTCINTAGSGTYMMTVTNDISLTHPSILLTNSTATQITIEGNGHTVDANGHGRVLTVESIQNLTLHNLTLAGGNATTDALSADGGGLSLFCGEDVTCHWVLQNTVVRNNQANAGGGIRYVCGYHGGGDLLVEDSVIRDNQAAGAGGGLIYSSDEESLACAVTLRNTLIEGNQAVDGGAFRILRPRVNIIDSTIRNNVATQNGGGLMARISDGFITTTVSNSTISGNRAGLNGGGLYIASPDQTFDIKLINSTVSSNTATSGTGGGLYLRESNDSLHITLINSTVTQNAASQGAGVQVFHQEASTELTGTLRLNNSIVANNLGSDCAGATDDGVVFTGQRVTSYGHNLDSDGTCLTPSVRQASDLPSGNANLGPLADNGGPTLTHALLVGSQAIDAGDDAVCAAEPINNVDQRGVIRPQGLHCDIGAYEVVVTPPPPCDFTAHDEASLQAAITCVNTAGSGTHTITFTNDISLTQPSPLLTNPQATQVILVGNGHTLDAKGYGRVLSVRLTHVTLNQLTLRGGRLPIDGELEDSGGGIQLSGEHGAGTCGLTLIDSTLEDNQASSGGALADLCDGSVVTITNSLIQNNHATRGGGIFIPTGEELFSELVMTNSKVINNRAEVQAGGIDLAAGDAGTNATIMDSTIASNTVVSGNGGGIRVRTGEAAITNLKLRNVALTNNIATLGGGLYVDSHGTTSVTVGNSTISSNQAVNGTGGGLFIQGVAEFDATDIRLINSTIANNAATEGGGIYKLDGLLTLSNTLVAMNATGGDCKLTASPDVTSRLISGGHNLDSDGTCLPTAVRQASDIPAGSVNLGPLADNGGSTLTHALLTGSQAIDAGDDAVCAANPINGVDQRGIIRPQGIHCDIGAYEAAAVPPSTDTFLFVSAKSSGQAGNIKFRDEDILAYDLAHDTWHMVFDGSDVGVTKDVDAFHFMPDGTLLLSFNGPTTVPGLGQVDDSDIVRFIPTALGDYTIGTFAWYLHGQDVGLTTDGADIDAIGFTADGHLVVSMIGDFNAPNATGHDEDLAQLNNATFGNPSSGTWSQYLMAPLWA